MCRWTTFGGVLVLTVALMAGCGSSEPQGTKEQSAPQTTAQETVSGQSAAAEATNLKDAFEHDFLVGVATTSGYAVSGQYSDVIQENFNSMTMENEMKPESILDWQGSEKSSDGMPAIKEDALEKPLKAAKETGIKLRGHTLVWHSQTPQWFFSKDYEPSKGLVDKKTMRKRMESYIKQVLTYCEENYPGVVYAWDVTNEVMGDGGGYRTESMWYQTYGDDSFILDAFTFARKYAGKDVKLFLNDYNTYEANKRDMILAKVRELNEKGLIDGIGMQCHWDMDYPSVTLFETALEKFGEFKDLEIQLTEIDMHNTDDSEEGLKKQADRYREFFDVIVNYDRSGKANITSVTFWGLLDEESWLSGFRGETSYPLLFSGSCEKKPCYDSIREAAKQGK